MWPHKDVEPELVEVPDAKTSLSICQIRDAKTQKVLLTISGQNGTNAYAAMYTLINELTRKTAIMARLNEDLQLARKETRKAEKALSDIANITKEWRE